MWRRQKRDRGQDLVEYAIVFPVLMLLVLGVFEFGRIIYSYNAISNLAREGVRYAVVPAHQDEIEDITDQPCTAASNPIVQNVCSHALALPGTLKVSISQEDASGQPDPDVVHIEVAYEGEFLTSYVRQTFDPCMCDLVLKAAATMRLE